MKSLTLVPYFGGKSARGAANIIPLFPDHRVYVEPFGGAAGVLLNKAPSPVEVYNDKSGGIVRLMQVVRDNADELVRRLELTPYARQEWKNCQDCYRSEEWAKITDPIEQARIFYVVLSQSFTGTATNGGWSFGGIKHRANVAGGFYNLLENIQIISRRLRSVQIENSEALGLMERWDNTETLFYLDPPYLPETRGQRTKGRKQYEHEMTFEQHEELLNFCLMARASIIISGYSSALYNETLLPNGWKLEQFAAYATSAMYTTANGGKGRPFEDIKRTECIWINPAAAGGQLKLFG